MLNRPTKTLIGPKAREAVRSGVNAIYFPVRESFGPEGKSALIYRTMNRGPRITVDGVTIAEVQCPKDPFIRMAAEAFREGCKRTVDKVGDGTTATAVIGGKLFNDLYKLLTEETSALDIGGKMGVLTMRKHLFDTAKVVEDAVLAAAEKIDPAKDKETARKELERIATISVKDAELGKVVSDIALEVGVDGYIDVTEGYKGKIEVELIRGMRFPAKVAAKAFVNNPQRYEMIATDVQVLITNYALDNVKQMANAIGPLLQNKVTKLLVIAPSFSEAVLEEFFKSMYAINADGQRVRKPGVDIYPVVGASLRTEQMDDLAVYCGATVIDKNKGRKLENVKIDDLGFFEKVVVKDTEAKEDAVATGGRGTQEITITDVEAKEVDSEKKGKKEIKKVFTDRVTTPIAERIAILKGQLEETKDEVFKLVLHRRIASMSSAVGIIRVGGSTQADSLYTKLKIEDAVFACKAALRGGYVKGGGLCLKEIADTLPDTDLLKGALQEPYRLIQESTGGVEITDEIIDPAEAIFYAVRHAVGIVANLITVEVITPELEDTHSDGEAMIARSIGELSIAVKRHFGLLNASEEEAERDRIEAWDRVMIEDKD